MTYRGRVKNGVIALDPPAELPEGTRVEVQPVSEEAEAPTLYERYKDFIGIAEALPADMAENHDHYIHGTPPRKS
jgi:hypothetical protein